MDVLLKHGVVRLLSLYVLVNALHPFVELPNHQPNFLKKQEVLITHVAPDVHLNFVADWVWAVRRLACLLEGRVSDLESLHLNHTWLNRDYRSGFRIWHQSRTWVKRLLPSELGGLAVKLLYIHYVWWALLNPAQSTSKGDSSLVHCLWVDLRAAIDVSSFDVGES